MKHSVFNGNVIDIEASGLGPNGYPIEVGIVLGNGESYEALVAPHQDWQHWDAEAEALHGITRAELERHGRPPSEICAELNALCRNRTLYSDCWVLDAPWLTKLYASAGMNQAFHVSPMEALVDDELLVHWNAMKHQYSRCAQIPPHRALNDAIIISETLERLVVSSSHRMTAGLPLAASA